MGQNLELYVVNEAPEEPAYGDPVAAPSAWFDLDRSYPLFKALEALLPEPIVPWVLEDRTMTRRSMDDRGPLTRLPVRAFCEPSLIALTTSVWNKTVLTFLSLQEPFAWVILDWC